MRIIHGLPGSRMRTSLCLAAGVFDGVHLGHREIITTALHLAAHHGCVPAVLTFTPHPDAILTARGAPPLLTNLEEKLALLRSLGMQVAVVARFDRSLADMSAEAFVREILVRRLHTCCLTVGEGWRFGAGGGGNNELLQHMAQAWGFTFRGCAPVTVGGAIVSSTRIRLAIASGQMEEAAQLLGRPYQLSNPVQPGARLGRKLGFPTANLYPPSDKVIPPDGVYACWAGVGRFSPAVASIGLRPTLVIGGERLIEVHLLDSSHRPRLTGRKLRVALVARLREERRFGSKEALARQIAEDCWQARSLLAALQPPVDML